MYLLYCCYTIYKHVFSVHRESLSMEAHEGYNVDNDDQSPTSGDQLAVLMAWLGLNKLWICVALIMPLVAVLQVMVLIRLDNVFVLVQLCGLVDARLTPLDHEDAAAGNDTLEGG